MGEKLTCPPPPKNTCSIISALWTIAPAKENHVKGENSIPRIKTSFNRSILIESGSHNVTADAGALALCEAMELTGIIEFLFKCVPAILWYRLMQK